MLIKIQYYQVFLKHYFVHHFDFFDTMSVIPIHMPINKSLNKKSVSEIYKQLLKKNFCAHRALNDVWALIKIMKHLKISF